MQTLPQWSRHTNGETLQGGDQEVNLELDFRLIREKAFEASPGANTFCSHGKLHDADIENELIFGYPWLQENNLAVLPAGEALACRLQNEILLGGWEPPKTDFESTTAWKIRKMNLHEVQGKGVPAEHSWLGPPNFQKLGKSATEEIEQKLRDTEVIHVRKIVSSDGEWGEHQQLVDGPRQALHRD